MYHMFTQDQFSLSKIKTNQHCKSRCILFNLRSRLIKVLTWHKSKISLIINKYQPLEYLDCLWQVYFHYFARLLSETVNLEHPLRNATSLGMNHSISVAAKTPCFSYSLLDLSSLLHHRIVYFHSPVENNSTDIY
mgnify:CR=1 FL=1